MIHTPLFLSFLSLLSILIPLPWRYFQALPFILLLSEYIRNFHYYNYRLCHYLSLSLLSLLLLLYYYVIIIIIIVGIIIIIITTIVVVSLFVQFRHCGYYDMVKKASARK